MNKYLVGIEQLGYALLRQTQCLESLKLKDISCSNKIQYLTMYIVGILSYLSALVQALVAAMRKQVELHLCTFCYPKNGGGCTAPVRVAGISSPIEARITQVSDPTSVRRYILSPGETFITTSSAGFSGTEGCRMVTIADSSTFPAVSIRVRASSSEKLGKLIYQSKDRSRIKLFRRFGLDEVPVKLSENINVSTDRIVIGNTVSVSFVQELLRARSAPGL